MIKQIFKWLMIILAALLLFVVARGQYMKSKPKRTFPADKEMLAYFNQHRPEIARLVKRHRDFVYLENLKPGSTPLDKAEQNALMKKAGVQRLIGSSIGWHWYPEPYSEHTIRTLRSLYNRSAGNAATTQEVIETLKKEMPSLFKKDIPMLNEMQLGELTQVLEIEPADPRYWRIEERKVFMHFPQPPMIQNDRIIAITLSLDDLDSLRPAERILKSLDTSPSDWKRGECLLKPIDTQWFMAICKSYDHPIP